jgi:site-specific recombinase XerC
MSRKTAQKLAEYFAIPLNKAFTSQEETSPLEPSTVQRINTALSGFFTTLVKQDVLRKNPCTNAEK